MFIGHFALGFGAKKIRNRPSLGTFFLAAQFLDLLWPFLLLAGAEQVEIDPGNTAFTPLNFTYYPFSHGLPAVLLWSALFGSLYFIIKRDIKSSVLLGFLVLSHWLLDLITHRSDLPLLPFSDAKVGFGLWNSKLLTIVAEVLLFIGGVYLYANTTYAEKRKGNILLWSFVLFLMIIYILNIISPPPESSKDIAVVAMAQWLLIAWGYWIDNNRKPVG